MYIDTLSVSIRRQMCTVYKSALFSPCIVCTLDLCAVHNVQLDLCTVHNVHTLYLCTVHNVQLDLCIVHNVHTLDLCTVHYAKCDEATKQFPLRRLSTQDENIRLVIARAHKNGRLV